MENLGAAAAALQRTLPKARTPAACRTARPLDCRDVVVTACTASFPLQVVEFIAKKRISEI